MYLSSKTGDSWTKKNFPTNCGNPCKDHTAATLWLMWTRSLIVKRPRNVGVALHHISNLRCMENTEKFSPHLRDEIIEQNPSLISVNWFTGISPLQLLQLKWLILHKWMWRNSRLNQPPELVIITLLGSQEPSFTLKLLKTSWHI